jgi:hypothetical protein
LVGSFFSAGSVGAVGFVGAVGPTVGAEEQPSAVVKRHRLIVSVNIWYIFLHKVFIGSIPFLLLKVRISLYHTGKEKTNTKVLVLPM